jgi:putative sigma-54 modulation protein
MRLDIHHQGVEWSEEVRRHVERRLRFALERFEPRLMRAAVHVSDENGPRGGIDKRCRVLLRLRRHGELIVEVDDADLLAAVDRAADRAAHALVRELDRRRADRHHPTAR